MKSNLHIKFTNVFDLSRLHFDLLDREKTADRNFQKYRLARRHRSIDWRWQSRLLNWLQSHSLTIYRQKYYETHNLRTKKHIPVLLAGSIENQKNIARWHNSNR